MSENVVVPVVVRRADGTTVDARATAEVNGEDSTDDGFVLSDFRDLDGNPVVLADGDAMIIQPFWAPE